MDFKESVYSILVVSSAENFNSSLQSLLPEFKFSPICFEKSVSAAKRTMLERTFDFVIINSPVAGDAGIRFSIDLCHEKNNVALLLVKGELYAATYSKVSEHGVYVLSKPTSKGMVLQAADWMITTHERLKRLEKKTVSIEDKMQEIRMVNRAKWLLIDQLKMTEADAHRYIEKQAMDSCTSKKSVAENIIKTYS